MAIRCLIVDDSKAFLHAARTVLQSNGMEIVGAVSTGAEALRLAQELRPDLVLVDVQLCDESGIDVARRLSEAAHRPTIILISLRSQDDLAELIEAAPVAGFIPKNRLSAASIRQLLAG